MAERLQKRIAETGLCSRRQAEAMIAAGRVTVNGAPAVLGMSTEPEDIVCLDGKPIGVRPEKCYIMLNKPRGFVTTAQDEKGRPTVLSLLSGLETRVYPVGRLDMFSEGLLLLTNDGELTKFLTHPSHRVVKQYQVRVCGDVDAGLRVLRAPMELDGRPLSPCRVRVLHRSGESTLLLFEITEGRNRQIRRMCEKASLRVVRLRRIAEGGVRLGDLPEGQWRHLTPEEVGMLKEMQELHDPCKNRAD